MPISVADFVSHLTETDPTIGGIWSDGVSEVLNLSVTKDEQAKRDALAPLILPWRLNVIHAEFSHSELWSVQQALSDSLPVDVNLKYVTSLGIDERRNRVAIHMLDISDTARAAVTAAVGPQPPSVCIDPVPDTPAFPA